MTDPDKFNIWQLQSTGLFLSSILKATYSPLVYKEGELERLFPFSLLLWQYLILSPKLWENKIKKVNLDCQDLIKLRNTRTLVNPTMEVCFWGYFHVGGRRICPGYGQHLTTGWWPSRMKREETLSGTHALSSASWTASYEQPLA